MPSRTLLIGDLHGCARELDALLDRAVPDRVLLVGDCFTKGPDPLGCWRIIQQLGARAVLGNHDAWVLDVRDGRRDPGTKPGRARFLAELGEAGALDWLEHLPLFIEDSAFLLVHAGIDPVAGRAGTSREQALTIRRWPDDADDRHPLWWERLTPETEGRLIVYGHDARRNLQDHRPLSLGLDSGCVYGGELTGYLVEEDRLVSVPAFEVYRDVGRRRR